MAIFGGRRRNGLQQQRRRHLWKCGCVFAECSDKWISKIAIALVFAIMLIILLFIFQPFQSEIHVLVINTKDPPIQILNPRYISVALDSSLIAEGFHSFNMTNPTLINVMKPLGGAYLRIGGTMANRLLFDAAGENSFKNRAFRTMDGDDCAYEEKLCMGLDRPNFTMSGLEWIQLNNLAIMTNFTILFDLNCLLRKEDGSWDSQNAEKLIKFSSDLNFDLIWELGNEPNSYYYVFNQKVNATQLAHDFKQLKRILRKYPRYRNSLVVGPDVTRPKNLNKGSVEYLTEFLVAVDGMDIINAITWHQYYFNGKDAFLYYFINPDIFNLLQKEISIVNNVVHEAGMDEVEIWLGETSSAYGGGAPTFSDRFISTFIWLDKLGLAAKSGISLIVRQSLVKGHYALINDLYDPNPDWWITVLFKQLVSNRVVECFMALPPEVRMYCHCNAENAYENKRAITVFGMNMKNSDAVIRLQEAESDNTESYTIRGFVLQTHISVLSRYVFLNDDMLLFTNGQLPHFVPTNVSSNLIIMPPFSLGFWILSSDNFVVCN